MELNRYIDHTILKAFAKEENVKKLCEEAAKYNFKSVCINPYYIGFAKKYLKELNSNIEICTVIGFPLGQNTTEVKVFEAKNAVELGATEIDLVINIAALLDEKYKYVENEIKK